MLPLSAYLDLTALPRFSHPTRRLLQIPDLLANQHEARAWEYGIALEAIGQWRNLHTFAAGSGLQASGIAPLEILDAGAATSNLWKALRAFTTRPITRVDPLFADPPVGLEGEGHSDLKADLAAVAQGVRAPYDVLTCISVIEHIPETAMEATLQAMATLLRPGGLLVLTTDAWDQDGPDTAHFHWMRERIYGPAALQVLRGQLTLLGFEPFGEVDYAYPGPQVYDYSFASIVMVKGEGS